MKMTATQLLKSVNNKKHILIDLDMRHFEGEDLWVWFSYSHEPTYFNFDTLPSAQNLDKGKITHFKREAMVVAPFQTQDARKAQMQLHYSSGSFRQTWWEKETKDSPEG